jgi:hypothetical protein
MINWRSTRYITRFLELLRRTLKRLVSQLHHYQSSNLKKGAGSSTERCLIFLFLDTVLTWKMTRWMAVYPWLVNFSYKPDHPHEFLVQTWEAIWISPIKPNFSYKPEHRHEFLVQTGGSHVNFSNKAEFLIQNWTPIWISHTQPEHRHEFLVQTGEAMWISHLKPNFSYKREHRHEFLV